MRHRADTPRYTVLLLGLSAHDLRRRALLPPTRTLPVRPLRVRAAETALCLAGATVSSAISGDIYNGTEPYRLPHHASYLPRRRRIRPRTYRENLHYMPMVYLLGVSSLAQKRKPLSFTATTLSPVSLCTCYSAAVTTAASIDTNAQLSTASGITAAAVIPGRKKAANKPRSGSTAAQVRKPRWLMLSCQPPCSRVPSVFIWPFPLKCIFFSLGDIFIGLFPPIVFSRKKQGNKMQLEA